MNDIFNINNPQNIIKYSKQIIRLFFKEGSYFLFLYKNPRIYN